jgi:RNA polymerase sigma-70 factor (ECF subfamily)
LKVDFEAEYRGCYGRVFGLCLRLLGGAVQAEDAAQEVFERAYRALDRYDAGQSFVAWVLGIARNHCIDLLRRRRSAPLRFGDEATELAEAQADEAHALDVLVDAERAAEIRAAIAALPEKYRLPVVLAYYSEAGYDEIAASLGITRTHVGVLLLRAKRALRRALAAPADEPLKRSEELRK